MRQKKSAEDKLVEIKHPRNDAIWGVRNGGYVAYVWDRGEAHFDPESRYQVQLEWGSEGVKDLGHYKAYPKAQDAARSGVKGRAFRHLLNRIS